VTGPGGGASATIVKPGESKTITFKALNPGIFIYHCAHPNVANHMAHGMYGLILVEPKEGLETVDKEFYIVQGEFYSVGSLGRTGLQLFDAQAMLDGKPQYIVFNGRTGSVTQNMTAEVGDKVRIYFGNGGVNLISSFHVIGEIFDAVYREGDLTSEPARDVQTTLVPAGGATAVEFQVDYPGKYILVDHALARLDRGAFGVITVTGEKDPTIFDGATEDGHGH
jgi:nitrite reductase (NO-forming)